MKEIKVCPACQGADLRKKYLCEDHTVSHETFQILQCANCTLAITSPRPDENTLGQYYLSEGYISHTGKAQSIIDKTYLTARKFTLRRKLKLINDLRSTPGNLLDYGCGTGEFLNTCKLNGWNAYGVEPSEKARTKAKESKLSNIYTSLSDIDANIKYDVITLWHVLEHVPDFNSVIQKLSNRLNQNGTIVVAVPNYESYDAEHYKEFWAGFDVPRHLWHFSTESMRVILKNNSLTLQKIIPMKLDSYYVSMLSEKYRAGKQTLSGLTKATFIGFLSNMKAAKKENHSSLIYIIKK